MPLTGEDFHNPKLTGPRASKDIPKGGLFSAYASTTINAPPGIVYDAILNVGDWKEWNTFIPEVTITKNPNPHDRAGGAHKRMTGGTHMILYGNLTHDPPEKIHVHGQVSIVEKLKLKSDGHNPPCITRIRWSLDNAAISTPGFLLNGERVNEIEEAQDGTTIYRTWQVFGGVGARFIRKKFEEPWRDRMQDWCRDLKKWCEEQAVAQPGVQKVDSSGGRGKSVGGQPVDPISPQ